MRMTTISLTDEGIWPPFANRGKWQCPTLARRASACAAVRVGPSTRARERAPRLLLRGLPFGSSEEDRADRDPTCSAHADQIARLTSARPHASAKRSLSCHEANIRTADYPAQDSEGHTVEPCEPKVVHGAHTLPALATPSLPAVAEAIGSSTALALKDPIGQSDATSKALGLPIGPGCPARLHKFYGPAIPTLLQTQLVRGPPLKVAPDTFSALTGYESGEPRSTRSSAQWPIRFLHEDSSSHGPFDHRRETP